MDFWHRQKSEKDVGSLFGQFFVFNHDILDFEKHLVWFFHFLFNLWRLSLQSFQCSDHFLIVKYISNNFW